MTDNMIGWALDTDGVLVLTMDDPNQGANTMNALYTSSMAATVDRLEAEKDSFVGVVLTSAKRTFFAGGDLRDMQAWGPQAKNPVSATEVTTHLNELKKVLRRLEVLGKPVVSAINGVALGGGLEIVLHTHHRIAADVKGNQLGLPEVTLGLLPGGGGISRVVRLLGIQGALANVLLQGPRLSPTRALELGLIDQVVGSVAELLPAAKAWIHDHADAIQPWDTKGFTIPGGGPADVKMAQVLPVIPSLLRKQLKGAPMPAPRAIMAAAIEGAYVDIDTADEIETRYFVSLVTGQVAQNMINAFFFDLQAINGGASRPDGYDKFTAKKVGVIGAGMMGAAIAYVSAQAGIDVVLKDVSLDAAAKGKQYAVALEAKALARGKTTAEKSEQLLARITPTTYAADFAGVDLVIEAAFESVEVKHQVFQEIENIVEPEAVLGSNTSTLPITILAEGVARSEDFIGIHFFSPVDKMPLVEIIKGAKTSDAVLARVIDYTQQIRKTPIVVNDSRGFFTSRVIGKFLDEAMAAVGEGVNPTFIEQAGAQAGYPAPPLQLMDELTLTLPQKIRKETERALLAAGETVPFHGSNAVMDRMVAELERTGRSGGGGFYSYDESGTRVGIWPGLREAFKSGSTEIPFEDMKERMLFAEALETVRCFDEGVLESVADANIGSIYGIGFPAWTGGVIQYINQYDGGLPGFVDRARDLASKYGSHFEPPQSLVEKAEVGEKY